MKLKSFFYFAMRTKRKPLSGTTSEIPTNPEMELHSNVPVFRYSLPMACQTCQKKTPSQLDREETFVQTGYRTVGINCISKNGEERGTLDITAVVIFAQTHTCRVILRSKRDGRRKYERRRRRSLPPATLHLHREMRWDFIGNQRTNSRLENIFYLQR